MKKHFLLLTAAPFALITPAMAEEAPKAPTAAVANETPEQGEADAQASAQQGPEKEVFSTGVAKGRDRLDSAISTSSIKQTEVEKLGARTLGEIFRNIPGIRAEATNGEGNNSYSIRGLPLASTGSKYMQLQEDGLPVLEFGDMFIGADTFMRADLTLSQIEAIRGGSASTFASNSPGGVINLLSKTGDVEGGTVMVSTGLNYGEKRLDFDYGGKLSDTLRYNVGGFYRSGEGPRDTGFTAYKGGQFKVNITKTFDNGYVRLTGKYLDDHAPAYLPVPVHVTGTNDNPKYENFAGFDVSKDSVLSPYINNMQALNGNNQVERYDLTEGMHPVVKSIGLDSQFDIAGFTISEKFRFADISGEINQFQPIYTAPAAQIAAMLGGAGATLRYATGPNAGQVISNPSTLNGNGLAMMNLLRSAKLNSLDNLTNDIRATRQWKIGGGTLTATMGYYKARQSLDADWMFINGISDLAGNGQTALLDIYTAGGAKRTQGGIDAYSSQIGNGGAHRKYDVEFDVDAPYGSLNYHIGKVAIGGSIRYDMGKAQGQLFGTELGGRGNGLTSYDVNGDGVISAPETSTAILPLDKPGNVDFDYNYLSYSAGINWRVAEPFAVFARYSKGGRGAADRVLFTPIVNYASGKLVDDRAGHDTVKQAEVGAKFRTGNATFNATGFWAKTAELNLQSVTDSNGNVTSQLIARTYKAYGAEFEGSYRRGIFSINAGATYTHAEIEADPLNAAVVGNTPRHQASFIFQAMPQVELKQFSVGANVVGTTSSFAQDTNQLKLPGFTTVAAFVQYRPIKGVELSLDASNLFDAKGYTEAGAATLPANGITTVRAILGRTISTSLRFDF